MGVHDCEMERVLLRVLGRLTEDDASAADGAIDLFLARFGDDQAARMLAVRRLTNAFAAQGEVREAAPAPAIAPPLQRDGAGSISPARPVT